jgi:hypothetical protein
MGHSPAIQQRRSICIPSQRLTTSRRSDALAEEHGQVDDDLVQEARVGALLDDVSRTEADDAIADDSCGLRDRAHDAVGDEAERTVRHVLGDHKDRHAS